MKNRQAAQMLFLTTLGFAISFAVWGMIAPMAKTFQKELHLTEQQTWLMIALPVLLGAVGRLPVGMCADRLGGRIVFGSLLILISIPAFVLSRAQSYHEMLLWGLILGLAGTSFSAGITLTSRWFPPEKQGLALGIYGVGNIGQSIALFSIPLLSGLLGSWQLTFKIFALVSLIYGIIFLLIARDSPVKIAPKPIGVMLKVLTTQPIVWLLALFYFVTFGGFVALGIGLPKLLQEIFHLKIADAGLRVAGFVLVATLMRPIGGVLSDKIGGAKLLMMVFLGAALMSLGMCFATIVPFTLGALGVAFFIGLGNGAVFKLVPQYFPNDTGTVTGLVGAMGGLGGFFPPLILGIIKTQTGHYTLGFVFLSLFCIVCLMLNYTVLLQHNGRDAVEHERHPEEHIDRKSKEKAAEV